VKSRTMAVSLQGTHYTINYLCRRAN